MGKHRIKIDTFLRASPSGMLGKWDVGGAVLHVSLKVRGAQCLER